MNNRSILIASGVAVALAFLGLMGVGIMKSQQQSMPQPTKSASVIDVRGDVEYSDQEIQERVKKLDPLSYQVIVEEGTEKAFDNPYWDNKAEGIYVDKVTGKALFSSTHKYDSGTGWPSFWRSIDEQAITMEEDNSLSTPRTEIRSAGGHLGHVFDDGPPAQGGQRFCTNSAALVFVPTEKMVEQGYEEYLYLFQ